MRIFSWKSLGTRLGSMYMYYVTYAFMAYGILGLISCTLHGDVEVLQCVSMAYIVTVYFTSDDFLSKMIWRVSNTVEWFSTPLLHAQ